MKKPRIIYLLLAVVMAFCSFAVASCGAEEEEAITLTITVANNDQLNNVAEYLKQKFPEIRFDIEYYSGSNSSTYLAWQADSGNASDIFLGTGVLSRELQQRSMLDLTAYIDITSKFTTSALNSIAVNGHYYMLPCTYQMSTYIYNKSLFEEKNWTAPASHEELVALVRKIRAEGDGIVPIGVSSYAPGPLFQYLGAFAQADFLAKADGIMWEDSFLAGNETAEAGFGDAADMIIELAAAGAFDAQYNNIAEDKLIPELAERRVAIIVNSFVDKLSVQETTDEFSAFPFFGKNGEKIINLNPVKALGLSKKLADSPAKLKKALQVLEALCTVEGLDLLKTNSSNIYPLKDVRGSSSEVFASVQSDLNAGYTAAPIYTGYEYVSGPCGNAVHSCMFDGGTRDQILSALNAVNDESFKPVGVVDDDLSLAETVQFCVDLYNTIMVQRESGIEKLGDFALASVGGRRQGITNAGGINGKMYKGNIPVPLGEAINFKYNAKIAVLGLTGSEVCELIENGRNITSGDITANFEYYWSGIEVTFDPKGKATVKYNGQQLESDRTYRVVMTEGDFFGTARKETASEGGETVVTPATGYYTKIVEYAPLNTTAYFVEWLRTNHVKRPIRLCR